MTRILGIDLSDMGTLLAYYGEERCWSYPTAICRHKVSQEWLIGEEAYGAALDGVGIMTDKLLTLAAKRGTSTIDSIKYTGRELLRQFLKTVIDVTVADTGSGYPDCIVVTIPKIDSFSVRLVTDCFTKLGYRPDTIHVISRSEAFIYYVMSQNSDISNNYVGMFSISDAMLTYYEMKVQRQGRQTYVYADMEQMDEGFNLEILSTSSGRKLADRILTGCSERLLRKKIYSCIILQGTAFENQDWAPQFMQFICMRRKVYVDTEVFVRGAGFRGYDISGERPVFNFSCICDGRLDTSVSIDIMKGDANTAYPLASIGDTWYDLDVAIRLIPDNIGFVDINVQPIDIRRKKTIRIPLDFLPKRPPKAGMISLRTTFPNAHTMTVEIKDAGFGEIFPATDASVKREVHLWD